MLFDSAAVKHKVLPTWRERGIENDVSSEIGRGGGEWKGGEVQTGYAPRKKKRKKTHMAKRGHPLIGIK